MKTLDFGMMQMDALELCLRICIPNHRKYGITPDQLSCMELLHARIKKSIATEEVYVEAEDIFDTIRANRGAFKFSSEYADATISLRKVVTKQIRYSNAMTEDADTYQTTLVDSGIQIRLSALLKKLDEGK